jgi:probable phosphomutase (TIGR03848 family)
MTIIYLIRHAENDFLGKEKLAGWLPGVHLNDRGVAQAEALAERLAGTRFRAIYASPLERALETAEPIARRQGLQVIPRPALGEVRFGRWQGQTLKTLRRRKLWPIVLFSPSLARFPEGESFNETQARVVAELEKLRGKHKQAKSTILCVSHSDTIKLAVAHYLGLPLDLFQRLTVEPASISILSIHQGHARLIRLNDTQASRLPYER